MPDACAAHSVSLYFLPLLFVRMSPCTASQSEIGGIWFKLRNQDGKLACSSGFQASCARSLQLSMLLLRLRAPMPNSIQQFKTQRTIPPFRPTRQLYLAFPLVVPSALFSHHLELQYSIYVWTTCSCSMSCSRSGCNNFAAFRITFRIFNHIDFER